MSDTSKYDKKTPREHVLARPDTYIGDIELTKEIMWIYNEDKNLIQKKKISFTPGFLKIFDEILVNARDHSINDPGCDTIKVEYNKEEGFISVFNNGSKPIPVEEHPTHKVLVPSMIFGEMLSGSNFDDTKKRTTGGRNGYGAKLANIFSKEFSVEILDTKRKKKFKQTWKNNMSEVSKAKVTDFSSGDNYVKITCYPDLEKFGLKELDDNHFKLFHRRSIDILGVSSNKLKVFFNGKKIPVNTFKKYSELYYPNETILFDDKNERWKVGCIFMPDSNQEVISFVNGISTYRGGTHVNHVVDKIVKSLITEMKKKEKDLKVSTTIVKENLIFFINATVENPAFSSQTKDTLTTKVQKFGSSYTPDNAFLKKLMKSGILKQVLQLAKFKASNNLKKNDGKKKVKLRGIPKLEDANKAGSKDSQDCTLILTEGDSAKAFAMAGLSIIGRDFYGVFPLKGKLLNIREASIKQRNENDEINYLKQIMGLKMNTDYSIDENFSTLRYGKIMCLTDQDVDGSHIKGLLMNFFHFLWPSLIQRKGFITSLATPIVKAFKGKSVKIFYNLTEYENWKEKDSSKGWTTKYYKGLGTSTSKEAKEYFVNVDDKLIKYYWKELKEDSDSDGDSDSDEESDSIPNIDPNDDAITKAFAKKRADDRKSWLMQYDKNDILTYEQRDVSYPEFIDKDMIHFSDDDLSRSIPSIMDGLKPSHRKILYGSFLRKLDKDEVKVAQLAGFVSDKAAYHHGEMSLTGAIVGMAQDFVGSNNINILKPNGQFGCVDPETNILLWNGTIKKASEIKLSDKLVGDDGKPRIISKIINGRDTMYEITNGKMDKYIVNSNHILTCQLSGHKSIYWKESNQTWKMLYYDKNNNKFGEKSISTNKKSGNHFNKSKLTKEEAYNKMIEFSKNIQDDPIFDINLQQYLKLPKYIKQKIKGVLNKTTIEWQSQKVEIDPYILGSWLGDGMSDCHAFSSIDHEIIKAWAIWLDSIGCETVHCPNYNDHESCTYYIRRRGSAKDKSSFPIGSDLNSSKNCKGCITSKIITGACDWIFEKNSENFECNGYNSDNNKAVNLNPFKEIMKKNDLFKNKHVPIEYVVNSKENRLKLLAGMIDTDGSLKKQQDNYSYRIYQSKERIHILESLRIVAGSLGFRAKIYENKNDMCELAIFGYNLETIPIKVERKKISKNLHKFNPMIHNIKVKEIKNGRFCGWHIDSNERFLLGDFTITHNTRLKGGKDAASPRYIWTKLCKLTPLIFRPVDNPILNQQDDDGLPIEPEYYAPIIPIILINGAEGIGTGFSTKIPPYNPLDVINNILLLLDDESPKLMKPWWNKFTGKVVKIDKNNYETHGTYHKEDDKITITELPVGEWTTIYKEYLERELDKEGKKKNRKTVRLLSYTDNNTDTKVHFELKFNKGALKKISDLPKSYRLIKKYSTTNMHLYSVDNNIRKYLTINDILKEYYQKRLELYQKRKDHQLNNLKKELDFLNYKVKFILQVIKKEIKINNRKKADIESKLFVLKYPKLGKDESYQYLLGMPIYSLTFEKVQELQKQKNDKEIEYEKLKKTDIKDIWKSELNELLKEYNKWLDEKMKEEDQ